MKHINVYYTPAQVASPDSYSQSPRKPAWVVEDWVARSLSIRVIEPVPVDRSQLALAHAPAYVDGILDCVLRNGFNGRQKDVADSLPWTCGSMLSAARGALESGLVACSPTSGFHHAGYEDPFGYCTFNGLVVTAQVLKTEGRVGRVGILDCDFHYGDGTAQIIERLGLGWIQHVTQRHGYEPEQASFMRDLPDLVRSFAGCDLLLYQAGADQHIDDPLGGFLTTDQLALRDQIVFSEARRLGLPVAWNLAGGYQEPVSLVLDIHRNTLLTCAAAFA